MQYAPKKGDRAKRDDDRYLFLEALLSAQQMFYISYIGQSQKDGKEMLPSILVSQLLDAMNEALTPECKQQLSDEVEVLVRKQPLSVFSKRILPTHEITLITQSGLSSRLLPYKIFLVSL